MDIMTEEYSRIKPSENAKASVVPTQTADLLTIVLIAINALSPITPEMKLGAPTKETVDTIGTIMKLKLVGI